MNQNSNHYYIVKETCAKERLLQNSKLFKSVLKVRRIKISIQTPTSNFAATQQNKYKGYQDQSIIFSLSYSVNQRADDSVK